MGVDGAALTRAAALEFALSPGFEAGDLVALGLAFLGFALFVAIAALSHEHDRPFSATIVYLLLGLLAAQAMAALGVAPLDPLADEEVVERLTELALIVGPELPKLA